MTDELSRLPRLYCFACGFARFSLFSRARVPEIPPRWFGLVRGTPAVPEHLIATCLSCMRSHRVEIGEYRVVTPGTAPQSEYAQEAARIEASFSGGEERSDNG